MSSSADVRITRSKANTNNNNNNNDSEDNNYNKFADEDTDDSNDVQRTSIKGQLKLTEARSYVSSSGASCSSSESSDEISMPKKSEADVLKSKCLQFSNGLDFSNLHVNLHIKS